MLHSYYKYATFQILTFVCLDVLIADDHQIFINYRHLQFPTHTSRILGGKLADIKAHPYTACLVQHIPYVEPDFKGGAVIISQYWALTAAHVMLIINETEINKGMLRVRGNTSECVVNYIEHVVSYVLVPDKYKWNRNDTNFDIAALKVKKKFDGRYEAPIPLANPNYRHVNGSVATILGWGSLYPMLTMITDDLYYAEIDLLDQKTCQKIWRKYKTKITAGMLCATATGKDACRNDSGGPMVQNGTLIGIVSFGFFKCAAGIPGVYTKISFFYKWIVKHTHIKNV